MPLVPVQRRFLRRDGAELQFEVHDRLVRNGRGEITGIRAALLDVTARVATERAAREAAETLRAVFASSLDATVMMDSEGRAVLWNPAAEKMFGYTAAEMLGQPLHDLLAPAGPRSGFLANFPAFLETGKGPPSARSRS